MKKNFSKRLVTFALAVVLLVTLLLPFTASAATNYQVKTLKANTWAADSYNSSNTIRYTYYKLTAATAGELAFTLTSGSYVAICQSLDDCANYTHNKSTTTISYQSECKSVAVEKGTYYLRVDGKVKYKFTKAVNKTNYIASKAIKLKANKTVKIVLSPKMNYARWYKITTTGKKKISYWSNSGDHAYNIEVYNSKMQKLETVKAGSDLKYCTKAKQPKGTYYLRVKSTNKYYGSYDYSFGDVVTLKWK